jgi:hypothetical protein
MGKHSEAPSFVTKHPTLFAESRRRSADRSVTPKNKSSNCMTIRKEMLTPSSYKMSIAMELMAAAKTSLEKSRCLFEAGVLFDNIGLHDRALSCFLKSRQKGSVEAIVEEVYMTESVDLSRKLERMSGPRREAFLEAREQVKAAYIVAEDERHRLRELIAVLMIVRLHLIMGSYVEVHSSMCELFQLCRLKTEHDFAFQYMHALLGSMSVSHTHTLHDIDCWHTISAPC